MLQQSSVTSEKAAVFIVATNLCVVVLAGGFMFKEIVIETRRDYIALKQRRHDAIQAIVKRKWKKAYRYALFRACTEKQFQPKGFLSIPAMLELVRQYVHDRRLKLHIRDDDGELKNHLE
jgi:hypothetical protein